MTTVYQKKPLASGLGLTSLLIQEYSQYMSCYHKIQLVKYHCCCSSWTKGLDKKVLENLFDCLYRHIMFTLSRISVLKCMLI